MFFLCYDSDEDDIFNYKKQLYNYKFQFILTKNISKGPCSAVKNWTFKK